VIVLLSPPQPIFSDKFLPVPPRQERKFVRGKPRAYPRPPACFPDKRKAPAKPERNKFLNIFRPITACEAALYKPVSVVQRPWPRFRPRARRSSTPENRLCAALRQGLPQDRFRQALGSRLHCVKGTWM